MAGVLLAQPLAQQTDSNAKPVSGSAWYFYLTGTTTPATVYADAALTTELGNPVEADSAGRLSNIYLDPNVVYRLTIKDQASGSTIRDIDPVNNKFIDAGDPATARALLDVYSKEEVQTRALAENDAPNTGFSSRPRSLFGAQAGNRIERGSDRQPFAPPLPATRSPRPRTTPP